MKLKNILSILLVMAMLFSLTLLTSCDGEEDNGDGGNTPVSDTKYTLTVVDKDGEAVEGVGVLFFDGTYKQATTGADGKASAELTGSEVLVSIISVPTGCTKPAPTVEGSYHGRFEAESRELTLTVERTSQETVDYTVNVVDQNGDAVVGAQVQVCHGSICEAPRLTDENGKMTIALASGLALDVKIYSLPEGYTAPDAIKDGGYHAYLEAGSTEITVTVTKNA